MQHTTSGQVTLTLETIGNTPPQDTISDRTCALGHRNAGEKCKCKSCPLRQQVAQPNAIEAEEDPERWDGLS